MDKYLPRVLRVDLTKKRFWVEERPDLFERGLGGAGVAIELLHELCPKGADPLGPENPIILAVGPLNPLFPLASKAVAMFKSPHTGNLGESHCGGRAALALRLAGFGALVIQGRSEVPVYLAIHRGRVQFRDARALWGLSSSLTVGRVLRENEPGAGARTILRIGRAGERLVTYANVIAETYRHFGRLGLGAVFGSKNLKAVVISGTVTVPIPDPPRYQKLYRELWERATRSDLMRKYHDLGTAQNIRPLHEIGALPVRNLLATGFPGEPSFTGEKLAQEFLGRRLACSACPVACIHLAILREPHPAEPYFYKTTFVSYDHEPLYALGSMLGMERAEDVLKLIDAVEVFGLDALTTGVVLAWATEAFERGLFGEGETGGLRPSWGNAAVYLEMIRRIAQREGEFYYVLGQGVRAASARYGGEEFALHFGGNEMPGYHTGPGALLTHLSGSRHSHLDSAGYLLDQENLQRGRKPSPEELARELFQEEARRQILSSLVVCFFARGLYDFGTISGALAALGIERTPEELENLGIQILRRKYAFKVREGFELEGLPIPQRAVEAPTPSGRVEEEFLRRALREMARLLEGEDGMA
ncbi:MAG: aldehyde ferredoxin oxidoreductase N-terminal domain-containing protein [Candidatus Bipolaricaulaceae bacterium]